MPVNLSGYILLRNQWRKYLPIVLELLYKSPTVKGITPELGKMVGANVDRRYICNLFNHINQQRTGGAEPLLDPVEYCLGKGNRVSAKVLHKILEVPKPEPGVNLDEKKKAEHVQGLLDLLRSKKAGSLMEIADELSIPPRQAQWLVDEARRAGLIDQTAVDKMIYVKEPTVTPFARARIVNIEPVSNKILLGVMSDFHYGSKVCMKDEIVDAIETMYKIGVRTILVSGDCVDGNNVYNGQNDELSVWRLDLQIDELINNLPRKEGLKYYWITGNHDLASRKLTGMDMARIVSGERKDMVYLGQLQATICLPDEKGIDIQLNHTGRGRRAYALSYPIQKIVETISGGSKPHILITGHFHYELEIPNLRNIYCIAPGCFQGPTTLTIRESIPVSIACAILTLGVDKNKWVKEVDCKWLRYYLGVKGAGHKVKKIEGWEEE